jgi:hypothetical protein
MINIRNIENIIYITTFLIAYLIAETLSGWFRAYVAKKMGDDTPADLGFLTLNPLMHIDPIGIFFLIKFGIGWGRAAPITPANITEPYKNLKLACAFFSDTFAHLFLACSSFILLISIFGTQMITLAEMMLFYQDISLPYLNSYYPHTSSFMLNLAIILLAMLNLCIILAVLNFIVNGFRLIMHVFYGDFLGLWYIDLIIPIMLIYLFAERLQLFVIKLIIYLANYLAFLTTFFT